MLAPSVIVRNLGRGDAYVKRVFDTVAEKYDLMNDLLSVGVHRMWKRHFVHDIVRPQPGQTFLDVAGGTGDIAFLIREQLLKRSAGFGRAPSSLGKITVLDINEKMLDVGKGRSKDKGSNYTKDFSWVHASAEELPFPDNCFTTYTVAFGIRNMTHRDKALKEALRVLKVGGALHVLEFSKVDCFPLSQLYNVWGDYVMPCMGRMLSDEESYRYLVDSIRAFPNQEDFASMIRQSGFGYVTYENLSSGIACIHTGVKTETGTTIAGIEIPINESKTPEDQS